MKFGNNSGVAGGASVAGDVSGRDCGFSFNNERLVLRSILGIEEGEVYAARLGEMMRRGLWKEIVDVSLMGVTKKGGGTVVVDLINEDGEIVDTKSEGFEGAFTEETFYSTSCSDKVGRVRVTNENNGSLSMQLNMY